MVRPVFDRAVDKLRHDRVAHAVDKLERLAVQAGEVTLEDELLDERILEVGEDERRRDERWMIRDVALEDVASIERAEIDRRRELLADAYPFAIEEGVLRHRQTRDPVYEFCLGVCFIGKGVPRSMLNTASPEFERLTGTVLASVFGARGRYYRLGHPPEGDRPGRFSDAVKELHAQSLEWRWQPSSRMDPAGHDDPNDAGCDIVAWPEMPDRRIGTTFVAAQCACGANWADKLGDLSAEGLGYYAELPVSGFAKVLSVPRHIPNSQRWSEVSNRAGVILDRTRLCLLYRDLVASRGTPPLDESLRRFVAQLLPRSRGDAGGSQ